MSSRPRSSIPSRCFTCLFTTSPSSTPSRVALTTSSRRVGRFLPDVVGADGQLPVAPVDHHRQLDRPRPPVGVHGVERRPDRAPGEQHVVDQDHHLAGEVDRDVGHRRGQHRAQADVVAVEGDVQRAERGPGAVDLLQGLGQGLGEGHAAGLEPDQHHLVEPVVALEDLVRHPPHGPAHVVGVEHLGAGRKTPPYGGVLRRSRSANRGPPRVLSVRVSQDPLHGQTGTVAARPAMYAHRRRGGHGRRPHLAATGTPQEPEAGRRGHPARGRVARIDAGPHLPQPQRLGQGPGRHQVDGGGRYAPAPGLGGEPPARPRHAVWPRRIRLNPTSPHTMSPSKGLITRSSARPRSRRSDSPAIQRRAAPGDGSEGTGFALATDGSRHAATRAAMSAGSIPPPPQPYPTRPRPTSTGTGRAQRDGLIPAAPRRPPRTARR